MANVCFVPLSYLFVRGQGIKLFSLCLKEFRKQKYIFPVIKLNKLYLCLSCNQNFYNFFQCPSCSSKKKLEIEIENMKYEGAIVLDPKCALYTDPVAVCDYKSLYPSSMISENICSSSKIARGVTRSRVASRTSRFRKNNLSVHCFFGNGSWY
jgi:DNA polymerase elongation subunit (family B)